MNGLNKNKEEKKELKTDDIISLITQNYEFLNVGLFLNEYIKRNNLSIEAKNINIKLDGRQRYLLRGSVIKDSLEDIYINSNKSNIFGYYIEWNAFRGIFMAVVEGVKCNKEFKEFLKSKLGEDKYEDFNAIIKFCRNILSHNIDNEIRLKEDDIKDIKEKKKIDFKFNYSKDFDKETLPQNFPKDYEDYGFEIKIDFQNMKIGDKFIDKISVYNLFMLAELCYNLVYFRKN